MTTKKQRKRARGFDRLLDKHVNTLSPSQNGVRNWMIHVLADIAMGDSIRLVRNRVNKNFSGNFKDKSLVLNLIEDIQKKGV